MLADESGPGSAALRIAERAALGEPMPEAIASGGSPEWRVLAAAWSTAEESGAPLAPALDRIGAALRALERLRERRSVLLAGPRATVRLVCALPPLALVLGGLLGFDPMSVLLSPMGAILLPTGVVLLLAGIAWASALRRRVEHGDRLDGLELELVRIALGGGAHPRIAVRRTVDCVDRLGAEWIPFDGFLRDGTLCAAIRTAERTGTPLGSILVEESIAARSRAEARLERSAERLGVRVLIPLGVCVLPSFVVLGVAPVLMAMLGAV
ncbi:type II secretion system F family protein [Leucobacter triazinivorans]|uniref:type II secretion system F family protein n=1 Tax=Leucobacter triazinivorans TaxID=1784719 RepID=UPI001F11447D|nr:type II secretion system F family protein [Leucobacter triazinivorans]